MKKNLAVFVCLYEFMHQIVDYDNLNLINCAYTIRKIKTQRNPMKKIINLIIAAFILYTTPVIAGNDAIKQLPINFEGAQYMFTGFGDTRTSKLGSLDGHDVVFSLARNKVLQSIGEQLIPSGRKRSWPYSSRQSTILGQYS